MKTRGDTVEKYDQMIGEGNAEGNAVVQAAIDGLIAQTRGIERVVSLLGADRRDHRGQSIPRQSGRRFPIGVAAGGVARIRRAALHPGVTGIC